MKRALFIIGIVLCTLWPREAALGQDWTRVLQLSGTRGSAAFFFNAQEGMIGTGNYLSRIPAQIYYTNDACATWKLAHFDNPNIRGQVTDIFFRDRERGWATVREYAETGWSGIYHSTDGGQSWTRVKQAGFPAGIRETSRGVFYTERDINPGVIFSSDTGKTWTHIASTQQTLGIDFMDDATGFVTSQASNALCPHLYTTDSGRTWQPVTTSSEAWTPYGDPISRSFYLASERDQLTFIAQTAVLKIPVGLAVENRVRTYGDSGLTGGIAGSHECQSVIYVQGRWPASPAPNGIIRTTDGGITWQFVGGPNNMNDKRFAVTGRGAVVVACDDSGGVWRTTDGGDGMLSPSVFPSVTLTVPIDTPRSAMCDSALFSIACSYRACDSIQILGVTFLNDTLNELSTPDYDNNFSFFTTSSSDTLRMLYRPQRPAHWTARIKLTILQPDGYMEDTIIGIPLIALPWPQNPLVVSGIRAHDTIDFDSVSICSDAYQTVTLNNRGCGNLRVDSLMTSGFPFFLASNVQEFTLTPGDSRTFLLHYTPDSTRQNRGELYVQNINGLDSVALLGVGYAAVQDVSISVPDTITAAECDSTRFEITLHNGACKSFAIDSIITNLPFRSSSIVMMDSVQPGEEAELSFSFIPKELGFDTETVYLVLSYSGTGRYDTTISLLGFGMPGKPEFMVSRDSVPLGTVLICSNASDTLTLRSSGCASVNVSAALDSTNGFSLARAPTTVLAPGDSDILVVQFQPNRTTGFFSSNLILTTSAGTVTIPVSAFVTDGGGAVAFDVSPKIQALTCQSQRFSITITDSLCDSISIDSVVLTGANATDFSLTDSLLLSISPGQKTIINGTFTPDDSLERTATMTCAIHEADGTERDTAITISALGISVPPIEVALGATQFNAGAGQTVTIPIMATRGSTSGLNTFDFALLMNSDLLTPLASTTKGFFGNTTPAISISRSTNASRVDTIHIQFQHGADGILPTGELCEIICEAYVSSELSTNINIANVQFQDANGSDQCLASETIPDTTATFTLNQACGDTTLAQTLGEPSLLIDGVSPNPTTGRVQLTFTVPSSYSNDGMLEIFDALGEKIGEQPIVFPANASGMQTIDLDLKYGQINNGIRYLRVLTPSGCLTAKVILLSEP